MAKPSGLHILRDTGPPEGSSTYTTVVLFHGFAWHSGIFSKLVPLATEHNARLVLVNRRDYPGATSYTPEERAVLEDALTSDPATARGQLLAYARERAREVYTLLVQFVADNDIPPAQPEANEGGIVIVGWSFGTNWMTSLLANVASFPVNDVELAKYVRRVVFHDPPYHALGFPPPADPYNPLQDPAIDPAGRTRVFANWVSGYYVHGDTLDTLERRTPLTSPPPTLSTLTDADRAAALYPAPGDPGGSDALLLVGGIQSGLFAALFERALALPTAQADSDGEDQVTDAWANVEVRNVWCDRSVWEMPWSVWNLRAKLESEKKAGRALRDVTLLRLKGANHFVHWDEPERALAAFLASKSETDQ
ncbi:alpha/beta-hydrolase [Polyporus arcularius HHB13444]|uniref:Alpha/beta-hydrolase n=1 Tax=Polyporus arcularius HHB13444 TaxID=1314778 RepID=A0A5C3Q0F2_9APHY|nr:alpha/beta-hydrolase [Polyporus arcularius HHB13444]